MHENGLIMPMVSYVLEKYATAEKRDLEGLDVDVRVILVPSVCPDPIGDKRRKETIEVEEEEDGQNAGNQQLNEEHPVEADVRTQWLRDNCARHGGLRSGLVGVDVGHVGLEKKASILGARGGRRAEE